MADYKKIMLNSNSMTETIDDTYSSAVNSQVDRFSTDYTADKLNELYNEFDSITLDNSAIDTITKRNAKVVEKVSARTKLYLTAGIVIAALLMFLMIYNFFVISNAQDSISILQDDITYQTYQVADRERQLNNATHDLDKVLEADGYKEVSSVTTISANVNDYQPLKGETNWFDKFCDFISSIFGG